MKTRKRSLHSSLWKTAVLGWCLWLRTGGSDNCALLLAVVATNFPQGSLGFSLLMCVNSLASTESAGSSNHKNFAIHKLYTAHTRALLMGSQINCWRGSWTSCESYWMDRVWHWFPCCCVFVFESTGFVFIVHVYEVRLLPTCVVLTNGITASIDTTFYV
jgi:hypothetical protein